MGFGFFKGVGGQMYVDIECLIHILSVDFNFLEVKEVECIVFNCWCIFGVQEPYFCGFWSFESVGGQIKFDA